MIKKNLRFVLKLIWVSVERYHICSLCSFDRFSQWLKYKIFGVGTPIRERLATPIRYELTATIYESSLSRLKIARFLWKLISCIKGLAVINIECRLSFNKRNSRIRPCQFTSIIYISIAFLISFKIVRDSASLQFKLYQCLAHNFALALTFSEI